MFGLNIHRCSNIWRSLVCHSLRLTTVVHKQIFYQLSPKKGQTKTYKTMIRLISPKIQFPMVFVDPQKFGSPKTINFPIWIPENVRFFPNSFPRSLEDDPTTGQSFPPLAETSQAESATLFFWKFLARRLSDAICAAAWESENFLEVGVEFPGKSRKIYQTLRLFARL